VRYKKVPEHLNQYLDTWDDSFRDRRENMRRIDDQFYELVSAEDDRVIKAKGPRIEVPMVALVGPQNSSATFQFALKCKQSGLGTLIGETTGGNLRGINGGYFFATLPESGIEFDVALISLLPNGPMPADAGVEPDITVAMTVADIANGTDPQMAAAIASLKDR
jgi:C-terminal processing protease CtpA/Prc